MTRKLYQELASRIVAIANCVKSNNQEWLAKHTQTAHELVKEFMPSGSGIDTGTKLDIDESNGDKLVFDFGFHHMNDAGMYDGWTEHRAIVTPSLMSGFDIKITGRDRNQIKEYLHEIFSFALEQVIVWDASRECYIVETGEQVNP